MHWSAKYKGARLVDISTYMNEQASYEKPKAPPSVIRISGTEPGVLDSSQRSRLLRTSHSTLSFASFDAYIAAPNDVNFAKLSLQGESCRPKRIVIETIPGHGSFWRWVPSARKMQDVEDEGIFPRVIDICGAYVECSQDQWDMYKLDPKYDCLVKFPPALTVISIKETYQDGTDTLKRELDSSSNLLEEESDVERMIVDDDNTPFNHEPPKRRSRAGRPLSPRVPHQFDFSFPPSTPEDPKPKKRANVAFQGLRPPEEEENEYFQEDSNHRNTKFYTPKYQKRARTLSPESKKRSLNANKFSRRNAKQEKWEQEKEARRQQREYHFMREVLSEVPPAQANGNANGHSNFADIPEEDEAQMADETSPVNDDPSHSTPKPQTEEEEAAQRLAESRRKMEELNADRARQRERERQVRGEEASTSRAKSEDPNIAYRKKQKQEEERRKEEARARQEEQARLRKEEEARRTRREHLERFERERRTRHQHWDNGAWSPARAVERYKAIGAFFDKARFSRDECPLTGIDIPWPTLRHPHINSARDMDWESVTHFFNSIKVGFRGQAYNDLVKTSLQRFHPDRWKSRNLYSAILDENERNEVETAISTISKAIGSLWAELKSSSEP